MGLEIEKWIGFGNGKVVDWERKSGGLEMDKYRIENGKVLNWKWKKYRIGNGEMENCGLET